MDLILLGSGNAATQLGNSLQKAGFRFVQLFSRREENARKLSKMLGDCPYTTDLSQIDPSKADAVISALKDSADEEVWQQIKFGNTPAFHTAGTMPMDALAPFAKHRGVLYPLQTLTKSRLLDFRSVPLFIEAESPETMTLLQTMANAISDNVREVNSEQRRSIHLAAVFANNFSNHMFALAEKILNRYGLVFSDLLPLIDETARKVHELSPRDAQTGPAIRYDGNIMNTQLELLSDEPEMGEIYRLISASIHKLAEEEEK